LLHKSRFPKDLGAKKLFIDNVLKKVKKYITYYGVLYLMPWLLIELNKHPKESLLMLLKFKTLKLSALIFNPNYSNDFKVIAQLLMHATGCLVFLPVFLFMHIIDSNTFTVL